MRKVLLWTTRTTCNFHCRYCYYLQENRENNEVKSIADIESKMKIIEPEVLYLSGEPTLYKNLNGVLSVIKKYTKLVVLTTHGANFNNEGLANDILSDHINAVLISLDGADAETNNYTRQDFDKVIKGINIMKQIISEKKLSCCFGITCVVNKKNLLKLEEITRFVISLGANYLHFQPVSLQPTTDNLDLILTNDEYKTMLNSIEHIIQSHFGEIEFDTVAYRESLKSIKFGGKFQHSCYGGKYIFFLDENLMLRGCPSVPAHTDELVVNKESDIVPCQKESINCVSMIELSRSKFPWSP